MADTCTITGRIVMLDGLPMRNIDVIASASDLFAGEDLVAGSASTKTDANGEFSLSLVVGAVVTLSIEGTGYTKRFTVPDLVTVNIGDL